MDLKMQRTNLTVGTVKRVLVHIQPKEDKKSEHKPFQSYSGFRQVWLYVS